MLARFASRFLWPEKPKIILISSKLLRMLIVRTAFSQTHSDGFFNNTRPEWLEELSHSMWTWNPYSLSSMPTSCLLIHFELIIVQCHLDRTHLDVEAKWSVLQSRKNNSNMISKKAVAYPIFRPLPFLTPIHYKRLRKIYCFSPPRVVFMSYPCWTLLLFFFISNWSSSCLRQSVLTACGLLFFHSAAYLQPKRILITNPRYYVETLLNTTNTGSVPI